MRTWLPPQELQATVNSEARNMTSVTCLKTTWHVKASGHLDCIEQRELSHFMDFLCCCFWHLKASHSMLQLFGRWLQLLFPVKLQRCFVDSQISSDLPLAWEWAGNDWIFIFGWTIPLTQGQAFLAQSHNHILFIVCVKWIVFQL